MLALKRVLRTAGFDKAVSVTLLGRIWSIAGGLGTLFFVARYLSPELQGYYYTFNSLIALQIFVELGLNFAIIQFVSHEMASLSWAEDGTITGMPEAKRRLQSLFQFALLWFGCAALALILIVLPLGLVFFRSAGGNAIPGGIEMPWMLVVVLTSLGLVLNAALAILEGCNKVGQVATIRFAQVFISALAVWAVLAAGGKLFAFATGAAFTFIVGIALLAGFQRRFFRDLLASRIDAPGVKWRSEIWPFQWRIAVSWASGYLIFHLFTPLLFATHGPIAAGRFGMSLQIISAMNGAAIVWVTTKAPLFGQLVARHERSVLDQLFKKSLSQSSLFLSVAVATAFGGLLYLSTAFPEYAERVIGPEYFAVLCLVCMANHVVSSEAAYLRAHKEDPFMGLSVISAGFTAALAFVLIPKAGHLGAIAAYAFGAVVIGLLGGTFVFLRKRRSFRNECLS